MLTLNEHLNLNSVAKTAVKDGFYQTMLLLGSSAVIWKKIQSLFLKLPRKLTFYICNF